MAGIRIEVDIYSGRRNPWWEPSDAEIDDLRRRLEQSRGERRDEQRPPPRLGYRGFVIRNPKLEANLPYRVEVFGGFVEIVETDKDARGERPRTELYADSGDLEQSLLDEAARRKLADDIMAMGGPKYKR
jgi:hypothetical protein